MDTRVEDKGGATLLACRYHDPAPVTWFLAFKGLFWSRNADTQDSNGPCFRAIWSGGRWLSVQPQGAHPPSRRLLRDWAISSSQLGHTNGQGASNPGAPCSPFSPLGPFLPFFPFSPCGYNDLVTLTSVFVWTFGKALLLGGGVIKRGGAVAHKRRKS